MFSKKNNAAFKLLEKNSLESPNKIAFIDDKEKITYLELKRKVQSFSNKLLEIGLKKNDRVILCMNDTINFPICFLGSIWAGIIPICINTMLNKNDLKYMLEDSKAKAVISSEELIEIFLELIESYDNSIVLISSFSKNKNRENNNIFNLIKILEHNITSEPTKTSNNSECFWLYSSGSTGQPKGTIHIQKSLSCTANLYAKNILKVKKNDIFFSAAKLFFAYGLGNSLTFPLSVGGTSILSKKRVTAELVSNIIKKNRVTLFFGVPTLYASIVNSNFKADDFKTLRLAVSAGEALPAHLYKKWKEVTGIKVLDGIGSTEMLHIFISNSITNITPGSSGKPVPGYRAKIIKDDNTEAGIDEIGELEIKGPSSAIKYWNMPEKSKYTFEDGWTKTGDKYTKSANGVFTYCGRADDMLKVSGQYVSPFEIEAALQSHPCVLEVAVVGKFNEDNLLKPKAFIVLNPNHKEEIQELQNILTKYVKSKLMPFKYPRWYEFVTALPKTTTGKIQRYKLRD